MRYWIAVLVGAMLTGACFIFAHVMGVRAEYYVEHGVVLTRRMRMLFAISTFWWEFRILIIPMLFSIPMWVAVITGIRKNSIAEARQDSASRTKPAAR